MNPSCGTLATAFSRRMALTGLASATALPLMFARTARADVSWEHRLSVRGGVGKSATAVSATIVNNWSEDKHRYALRVRPSDLEKMPPVPMGMGSAMALQSFAPAPMGTGGPLSALSAGLWQQAAREAVKQNGARTPRPEAAIEVGLIDDRAENLFTAYSSPNRKYVQEPLMATLKRLRFDPWKKVAPRLSQEEPEALTPRQRARLGAEIRSVTRPFLREEFRAYFRPLTRERTVACFEARGYRATFSFNTGSKKAPAWAQVKAEWWMAPEQEGDEIVRSFNKRGQQLMREVGGPTASMWLNELRSVLWQSLPQELHQSVATILPPEGAPNEMFGGTPLLMHLTIVPPPLVRLRSGEMRAELKLVSRSAEAVAPETFAVPSNFSREPLEPFLKQYEAQVGQGLDKFFSFPVVGNVAGRLPL